MNILDSGNLLVLEHLHVCKMSAREECAHSWQQKEIDVELLCMFYLTCTQLIPDNSYGI